MLLTNRNFNTTSLDKAKARLIPFQRPRKIRSQIATASDPASLQFPAPVCFSQGKGLHLHKDKESSENLYNATHSLPLLMEV